MSRKTLRTKRTEIGKAGKLLFDAIFGDTRDIERQVGEELDREAAARGEDVAISTTGYSYIACSVCAREQPIPANIDVRVLERDGWRFGAGVWRCPFCVSK